MTLPTDIDVPCRINANPNVLHDPIIYSFIVVDVPVYKGQTFTASIEEWRLSSDFGVEWPIIDDHFIIRKRGSTFTFGPNYTPLNV